MSLSIDSNGRHLWKQNRIINVNSDDEIRQVIDEMLGQYTKTANDRGLLSLQANLQITAFHKSRMQEVRVLIEQDRVCAPLKGDIKIWRVAAQHGQGVFDTTSDSWVARYREIAESASEREPDSLDGFRKEQQRAEQGSHGPSSSMLQARHLFDPDAPLERRKRTVSPSAGADGKETFASAREPSEGDGGSPPKSRPNINPKVDILEARRRFLAYVPPPMAGSEQPGITDPEQYAIVFFPTSRSDSVQEWVSAPGTARLPHKCRGWEL